MDTNATRYIVEATETSRTPPTTMKANAKDSNDLEEKVEKIFVRHHNSPFEKTIKDDVEKYTKNLKKKNKHKEGTDLHEIKSRQNYDPGFSLNEKGLKSPGYKAINDKNTRDRQVFYTFQCSDKTIL